MEWEISINNSMNYDNIYDQLMNRAKNRHLKGYKEKHHIVPRCMGGDDNEINLVTLTPEEHYVAHQLLVKMCRYQGTELYNRLVFAMNMMTVGRKKTNKKYGWARRKLSRAMSERFLGKSQTHEHIEKRREKLVGQKRTPETCLLISQRKTGVKRNWSPTEEQRQATRERMKEFRHSEEAKKKITGRRKGTPMTDAQKEQISKTQKGRTRNAETRARIAQAAKESWARRKLAKETNELKK